MYVDVHNKYFKLNSIINDFQTRNASIKNSMTMVQRPAPYHKLKNGVKFKLKPTASQELTKEKDENTYGTFSP